VADCVTNQEVPSEEKFSALVLHLLVGFHSVRDNQLKDSNCKELYKKVAASEPNLIYKHSCFIHIYIYIYICVCLCVCVVFYQNLQHTYFKF
jgi:hypothetical protein